MKKKMLFFGFLLLVLLSLVACSDTSTPKEEGDVYSDETISDDELDYMINGNDGEPAYTEEELESDPAAPSSNPDDYNSDGEYVPADGPTDNPEDYNSDGEYKPVEDMTQEEIQAELEEMLGN